MTKNYLGIDIGGTNTRIVLLRGLRSQNVRAISFRTPHSRRAVETELKKYIVLLTHGVRLSGIGVGVAGIVEKKRGRVGVAEHLPFLHGWHPRTFFRKHFRAPVQVENDARCFLHAEALWGRARGKKYVLGIAIGTGIGGAILFNGKMYRGTHEAAGEFGDIVMEHGKTFEESAAKKAFKRWGGRSAEIGRGIAGIISVLDPEVIILGGGAVSTGKINLAVVRRAVRRFAVSPEAGETPVVFGRLGDAAQAIGAALLFSKE